MPRVHTHTKSPRATKRPYFCTGCRQEIVAGQQYYSWERRHGGKQFRHVACGRPRPTELSGRKTAQVEEAVMDADLGSVTVEVPSDWDGNVESLDVSSFIDDLKSVLQEVADVAREVGEEYESGADNMPEQLQYGSQAEAMRDVASRLEDYASTMEDFDPSSDEPDWPERTDVPDEGDEESQAAAFVEMVEQALNDWAEDVRSEAQDALDEEIPEYEG